MAVQDISLPVNDVAAVVLFNDAKLVQNKFICF